jgi:hypothetical protein
MDAMMSFRFLRPNWSNWQKAILAALTASSMVSKMPMSRNGAAAELDDDDTLRTTPPPLPVRSATMRCAMSSIS